MIEQFSDEQISFIDQRLSEWRDAILCTKPADRTSTEQHLKRFYGLNGFKKPTVIWCESPWQMVALAFVLQIINKSGREKSCERWLRSRLNGFLFDTIWNKYDEARDTFDQLVRAPRDSALLNSDESKTLKEFLGLAMWKQWLDVDNAINEHMAGDAREMLHLKVQSEFQDVLWGAIQNPLEADLQTRLRLMGNQTMTSLNSTPRSQKLSPKDQNILNSFKKARATTSNSNAENAQSISRLTPHRLERAVILPPIARDDNFYAFIFLNSNLPIEIDRIVSHINWPWRDHTPLTHRLCCELIGSEGDHIEETYNIELWFNHMKSCLAILPLGYVCLACDRPSKLEVDQWNRLHSAAGPATEFPDNYQVYSWHGNVVESWYITNPEQISLAEIESEKNIVRRRILIEVFGEARFLTETGATIQDESEFGVLYRKPLPTDDDLVMVKVINSTMEPDGTWKSYFLRVPPSITTAKEAIAWTFNLDTEDYSPVLES